MRRPTAGKIRPKISTMPRQRSEAAAFLDIYKLTVEKKRLEQELDAIDQRRELIVQRLAVLDQAVQHLEDNVQQMRENDVSGADAEFAPGRSVYTSPTSGLAGNFDTLTLDY
ncbi:MAG: hypothetical protein IGR76_04215 [Synechococcales cyanobacterium T60_A2020_003]|nr:hypothetical protein [Synechococcales cyanobacterium T60_A2020_003]